MLVFNTYSCGKLLAQTSNLKDFLWDVVVLQHSLKIQRHKTIMPYEPSYFLYVYFLFNSFFNVDWMLSAQAGELMQHKTGSERTQIHKLLEFCYNDDSFVEKYKRTFYDIITIKYRPDEICDMMSQIKPDVAPKGNIKDENISEFLKSLSPFFKDKNLLLKDVYNILDFIYGIRCNIVHGSKTMNMLTDIAQRHRIMVYSYFLVATMHMCLCYLEFIANGEFETSYFIDRLKRKDQVVDNRLRIPNDR